MKTEDLLIYIINTSTEKYFHITLMYIIESSMLRTSL